MSKKVFSKPLVFFLKKLGFYKKNFYLSRILFSNPQKKAIVSKIRVTTPRKPNSARRKTIKSLFKFSKVVLSYIPGGQHSLKQYSLVLLRGQGARDLPGIYTTSVRGKFDLKPVTSKTKRRSVYGVKKKTFKNSCISKKTSDLVFLNTFNFSLKSNWFFFYKINFFFKNFLLNITTLSFYWEIPKKKKNKNKRIKVGFFFFKKNFHLFLFKVLKTKRVLNKKTIRFFFLNTFFFSFYRKEWLFLKKKIDALSGFIKKKKFKKNLNILNQKFYIKKSFFFKKKNKHLFNYNIGFSF